MICQQIQFDSHQIFIKSWIKYKTKNKKLLNFVLLNKALRQYPWLVIQVGATDTSHLSSRRFGVKLTFLSSEKHPIFVSPENTTKFPKTLPHFSLISFRFTSKAKPPKTPKTHVLGSVPLHSTFHKQLKGKEKKYFSNHRFQACKIAPYCFQILQLTSEIRNPRCLLGWKSQLLAPPPLSASPKTPQSDAGLDLVSFSSLKP